MPSVDMEAVECSINIAAVRVQHVKEKENLIKVSKIVQKPILRDGKRYVIIDGATAYLFDA